MSGHLNISCNMKSLRVAYISFGKLTVGKTSLITRFMYDSFDNTYQVSCLLTSHRDGLGVSLGQVPNFLLVAKLNRPPLESISFPKQCTLKIALCVFSCGIQQDKNDSGA